MTLADTYRDVAHQAMLDLVRQPREVVYAADPYIAALEAELAEARATYRQHYVDWETAAVKSEALLVSQMEANFAALEAEALQQTECAHKALKQRDRAEKKLDSMKIMERHADWKLRAEAAEARVAELARIIGDYIDAEEKAKQRAIEAEAAVERLNAAWKELRRQVAIYEKSGYDLYQRENGKAFGKMMDAVLGRPRGGRG